MEDESRSIPKPHAETNEKLLFLRENMVHLTGQLSMPVIEVALVVSKFIRIVSDSLREAANSTGEKIPDSILSPIPLKAPDIEAKDDSGIHTFPFDNLIGMVDQDRMDILDTLIRNVVNESELEFIHTLQELRQWEFQIRNQLSMVSGPGGLFSPLDLPEDF